jgi:hypothetical protein
MSPRSKPFMLNVEPPAGTVPVPGWALERRRRGDLLGPIAASLGVSESTISRFTSKELIYG